MNNQIDPVLEEKKKFVAGEIEKVLKENKMAIMPYIKRTESADIAMVALVPVQEEPEQATEEVAQPDVVTE